MLTYTLHDRRLELTATGTVTAEDSGVVFDRIREDPAVPCGCALLLDLREHDHSGVPMGEVGSRVMRMADLLGPKLGRFWAVVIHDEMEQVLKVRLLQHLVAGDIATVTIFQDLDEARRWLDTVG